MHAALARCISGGLTEYVDDFADHVTLASGLSMTCLDAYSSNLVEMTSWHTFEAISLPCIISELFTMQ